MTDFRRLVEARIRDFHRRRERGETAPAPQHTLEGSSLEAQLVNEIRALRAQGRDASDQADRSERLKRARELETQLLVLLERTGRATLARTLAERLREP